MNMSKNERAKRLMGLRPIGSVLEEKFIYKCPLCGNKPQLSEYNNFLWCKPCNLDIPEILCRYTLGKEQVKKTINDFLDMIEEIKINPSLKDYGEDTKAKTSLAYCIISILEKSGEMEFRKFRFILYELYTNLKTKHNIDIKLPHYWYTDGPHIFLRSMPAVFKLRVRKSESEPNIYKVTILLSKRMEFNEKKMF